VDRKDACGALPRNLTTSLLLGMLARLIVGALLLPPDLTQNLGIFDLVVFGQQKSLA
jgi:hypothetical protein